MTSRKAEDLVKKSFPIFSLLVLFWGGLLVGVMFVFFQMQVGNYERSLIEKEEHSLSLQRKMARNHFAMVVNDLLFLAKQEELKAYLEHPSDNHLSLINSEYRSFSANKRNYEQIRYLDNNGMEVVRVNYHGGQPVSILKENLQSKQNRYYFKDSIQLDQGEVFVSPFDLNIEQGKVEEPYKPMIRFATPVFDQAGTKRGIVLINYLGQDLLNLFLEISSVGQGQTMLVNGEGYWLFHPEAENGWGFMFSDKRHLNFAKKNPEIWTQILPRFSGQLRTPQGLYVYTTVTPLEPHYISSSGSGDAFSVSDREIAADEYFWKIVSFISTDLLSSNLSSLKTNIIGLGGILFLLGVAGLWPLAEAIARRKLYQEQLVSMAHYDALTGLPNRVLFFDRLHQSLLLAQRYERMCAVLYIDLDGFKSINDTFGHATGDELLAAVGERMMGCCRTSDTVARLGGDEFAIFLTEVANTDGVEILAKQILKVLKEPFSLKSQQAVIGASIGIAVFPANGKTLDQLLRNADTAMYLSKSRGKGIYTFA